MLTTGNRYKKPAKTNRATRGNVYEAPTFTVKHYTVVVKATAPVLSDTSTLPMSKIEISARTSKGGNKKRNKQEH